MAALEQQEPQLPGVMSAAAAFRAKYRLTKPRGGESKQRLSIRSLGVHPHNRGGVFPSGLRCKSVCQDVIQAGFVKEEVNHAAVVVEETPYEDLRSRGDAYVTGKAYNTAQSSADEHLVSCFQPPNDDVRYMMLSHNHMLLILRAFLGGARWDLPRDERRGITYCDDQGDLSRAAVAGNRNGGELAELCTEGITCEILSWKMDLEEPTAAAIISQALNKSSQLALRTTELTAVAVFKGEIIVQMSKNTSQRVAFETVRDRVQHQLDTAVDDPDLPAVFEFLISLGVGVNSYVDDFLDYASKFVDSKKRQLRLVAFLMVNQIAEQAPWTKVAVLKRAYRKKPASGFCPSPESTWGSCPLQLIEILEELLRYFHVACAQSFQSLPLGARAKTMANVDISAAEAFYQQTVSLKLTSKAKIQEALLESVAASAQNLKVGQGLDHAWIKFPTATAATPVHIDADLEAAPMVVVYDETSGSLINQQVDFSIDDPKKMPPTKLPWRTWRESESCALVGAQEADKASAVAVLHTLHERLKVECDPIDMLSSAENKTYVVARTDVDKEILMLPPCVPKLSKLFDRSTHPNAIGIIVKVMRPVGENEDSSGDAVLRTTTFYALPEFQGPRRNESAAVAAGQTESESATPVWVWGEGGNAETMHPCWAVRRLTEPQLAKEVAATPPNARKPRFNCHFVTHSLSNVCVATVDNTCINCTRLVEVPFLTNSTALEAGEELLICVQPQGQKGAPRKRTWQDALRDKKAGAARRRVSQE